jgi:hypothetical protein
MINLLLKLMLAAALLQFGMRASDVVFCNSRECTGRIEKASREVLQIKWKPISIFPEEAKRFR